MAPPQKSPKRLAKEAFDRVTGELDAVKRAAAKQRLKTHAKHISDEYIVELERLNIELVGARAACSRYDVNMG